MEQGWVLGGFFYGTVFANLFGGYLSEKFGGKWVVGLGNLIPAFGTLLTPMAAKHSITSLIVTRIIVGIGIVNQINFIKEDEREYN